MSFDGFDTVDDFDTFEGIESIDIIESIDSIGSIEGIESIDIIENIESYRYSSKKRDRWLMLLSVCLLLLVKRLTSACCQSIDKEQQANRKRLTEMVV